MRVFLDTSGILAVLDADDDNHPKAKDAWTALITSGTAFITHNYILVETFALAQHRLGFSAVRTVEEDILPIVHVEWVDELTHRLGVSALLAASRRRLSLVDCVSFEIMRRLGLREVFAFDRHFIEQGFHCLP